MWRTVGLFSDFQYSFRSSRSTTAFLTIIFNIIARALSRLGAMWSVALDISKVFDSVWHAGLHKLKSYWISIQVFGHIPLFGLIWAYIWPFLSNRWLGVVLDGKSLQEYPVTAGVPPFLVLHLVLHTLMTILMMLSVILLSMLMILVSTLSVISHLIYGNN